MKKDPVLQKVENDHILTNDTDQAFLCLLEQAVLLALLEDGVIDQIQYRCASERLKIQGGLA